MVVATTRALLIFAEERGVIQSAEDVWNDIIKLAEGANPKPNVQVFRPTRAP